MQERSLDDEGRAALILKEPYGVVLGIAPWWVTFMQRLKLETELIY